MSARKTGSASRSGEGVREPGKGIWEGVGVLPTVSPVRFLLLGGCFDCSDFGFVREDGFELNFDLGLIGEGKGSVASAGISTTSGRPECGPRRLRIEEKCSQS